MRITSLIVLIIALVSACSFPVNEPEKPFKNLNYQEGRLVYEAKCQVCHGKKGEGTKALYPPIASSDYLASHINEIPCILTQGLDGKIIVNGKDYDTRMLPHDDLSELQIADLMTFMLNSWQMNEGNFTKEDVRELLENCKE